MLKYIQGPSVTLSSKQRPDIVSHWIKCGRRTDPQPNISDVSKYSAAWWEWWADLQPQSRKGEDQSHLRQSVEDGESWAGLRKGGVNGIFNVIAAISWWLQVVQTRNEIEDVERAIDDVLWVIGRIVAGLEG